jgi:hypothetical protein
LPTKRRRVTYQGVTLEFSKISDSLFFGYSYHNGFYIASPQKALLDTLYYRQAIPVPDEMEPDNTLDFPALSETAARYPRSVSRTVRGLLEGWRGSEKGQNARQFLLNIRKFWLLGTGSGKKNTDTNKSVFFLPLSS